MAPSIPIVAALLSVSHAGRADIQDQNAMLQMPITSEKNVAVDQGTDVAVDQGMDEAVHEVTDECRCPAYYEAQCVAQRDQGCVWSDAGDSNAAWCQCLNPPVERTEQHQQTVEDHYQQQANWVPPVTTTTTTAEPTPVPEGWTQINENWNCAGSGSSGNDATISDAANSEECAAACYAEGHVIAGYWHTTRSVCRCYDTCDDGGETSMPAFPNVVMQRNFYLVSENMKCPHNHPDRVFREPSSGSSDISLAACRLQCRNTEHCAHYSWGLHDGGNVCMGCVSLRNDEVHVGFNTYDLEYSVPPVHMIHNWNFEQMTIGGAEGTQLAEGRWIHFLDDGNSGLSDTGIPGWTQVGTGSNSAGLYNTNNNEIAAEGNHVLFLNRGDDNNYVYQDLLEPFTATINIEAAVGGGNGGSDGGYRMGLYSQDGTLLQEVASGVNGAPDTLDNEYILTHLSVSVGDHQQFANQILQLRLMKNKSGQGHYHYIRFT